MVSAFLPLPCSVIGDSSRKCEGRRSRIRATDGADGNVQSYTPASGGGNLPLTWRKELDTLFLSSSPAEVGILSMDLLKRLPEVVEDVSRAVRKGTLLNEVVFAEGTQAKFNKDGLVAVRRQLKQDIIPEVAKGAPRAGDALASSIREVRDGLRDSGGILEVLKSNLPKASDIPSPRKVFDVINTIQEEAPNIVSR
ncbi:unnamed protein product [Choristocarpus tenellus]